MSAERQKEPAMSAERQDAPDEPRRDAGFGARWEMTISALVVVVLGLILGVFVLDSVPAITMTILLLAVATAFAVRSDLRRRTRR